MALPAAAGFLPLTLPSTLPPSFCSAFFAPCSHHPFNSINEKWFVWRSRVFWITLPVAVGCLGTVTAIRVYEDGGPWAWEGCQSRWGCTLQSMA